MKTWSIIKLCFVIVQLFRTSMYTRYLEFGFDLKNHLEIIVLGIVFFTTAPVIIKLFFGKSNKASWHKQQKKKYPFFSNKFFSKNSMFLFGDSFNKRSGISIENISNYSTWVSSDTLLHCSTEETRTTAARANHRALPDCSVIPTKTFERWLYRLAAQSMNRSNQSSPKKML